MTNKTSDILHSILSLALLIAAVIGLAYFFHPVYTATGTYDYFLACLLVGIPFGIGRMILFLPPASYGISGGIGVLALDLIVGGLIGCMALMLTLVSELVHLVQAITR